ncbi:MAG: DUF1003 domain-containing protein [Solirubrobacteraceae bacterium]
MPRSERSSLRTGFRTRSRRSPVRWRSSTSTSSGSPVGSGWASSIIQFGLLTIIVSLEAIFLSTFVMISQNRADTKRQVLADQTVEDGSGGGRTEQAAAQPHTTNPRANPGGPRLRRPREGQP